MIIEAREDTITLRGAIKSNIWAAIQAAAALLLENHPTGIIIDASGVTKCSAKGAETFADAFRYIHSHNARIVVAALPEDLVEISRSVPGVRSQLPLAASVEEARASLKLEEAEPRRGRAREAGLVPMLGNWRNALDHARRLALGESCELHLVDFIKVPLTLPLGTPLPERESQGQARLEEAAAAMKEAGVKTFSHVERIRSYRTGLMEYAAELRASFAVVSVDEDGRDEPLIEEPKALSLLEAVHFEMSLVKGAERSAGESRAHAVVPAVGAWEHALEHACKLVTTEGRATVVYIIEVPRSEPIDIPNADAAAAASDCAREAHRIGKRYGVEVDTVVERVRDPVLGFLKLFDSGEYGMVVVGVKRETTDDYHIAHTIATELMQNLPCQSVFLKVGNDEAEESE